MNETQQLQESLLLRVVGSIPTSISGVIMRPWDTHGVRCSALLHLRKQSDTVKISHSKLKDNSHKIISAHCHSANNYLLYLDFKFKQLSQTYCQTHKNLNQTLCMDFLTCKCINHSKHAGKCCHFYLKSVE